MQSQLLLGEKQPRKITESLCWRWSLRPLTYRN